MRYILYSGVKLRIGDICYRASEVSEILLVVDNAKSGICYMYLNTVAILLSGVITWQVCNNTCPVFKLVKA